MNDTQPITTLITRRFSCRKYLKQPIDSDRQQSLKASILELPAGPFGNIPRFELIAALEEDRRIIRGLSTYGFIRGATGFIIGATVPAEKFLEDFGFLLEILILKATGLGLGTCWLGGTFTKSSFARKISITSSEIVPAVVSTGIIADETRARKTELRNFLGATDRKNWADLFYASDFSLPLLRDDAGPYTTPLEMVRIGPSASNKQPWRIVKRGANWYFYLARTPGYREGFLSRIGGVVDLQRVDMGIAMCHFELTARELGLPGGWKVEDPGIETPDNLTEYVVTWFS
jgi:hypothetical protein